jgi:hypothetical protein
MASCATQHQDVDVGIDAETEFSLNEKFSCTLLAFLIPPDETLAGNCTRNRDGETTRKESIGDCRLAIRLQLIWAATSAWAWRW